MDIHGSDRDTAEDMLEQYSARYFGPDIFIQYPEAAFVPRYLHTHFPEAHIVLDLGFGTGLWFWASFLPGLKRLDGIDANPQALVYAERIFDGQDVPQGWRVAHRQIGEDLTRDDIGKLRQCRGKYHFFDYREPWPGEIADTRYDLVTEHGGGFGEFNSRDDIIGVVIRVSAVLNPGGNFFFMNIGAPGRFLTRDVFSDSAGASGMHLRDFRQQDTVIYGYMEK